MKGYEDLLSGGDPNSLGNTIEVVFDVLDNPDNFDELFKCYFSKNQVVRLRVSNAMKRILNANKKLLVPYIPKLLDEISRIDQSSAQWTLATLFEGLKPEMTEAQFGTAKEHLKKNLEVHDDWIVLTTTMETLGAWAVGDENLKNWLEPHLERIAKDEREAVQNKAHKVMKMLF